MDEQIRNDLFEIRLDQTGISYIRKLFRLSGVILIVLLLISLAVLIIDVRHILDERKLYIVDKRKAFWSLATNWLSILIVLLNLAGSFYYVKFLRTMNRSISVPDQNLFNSSFKYIYRNAVLFIMVLVLDLLLYGIMLLFTFMK